MPRSPSRTLPRNLKRESAVAGMLGAFVPPAHFRDRPPRGRSLPRAGKMGKTIHNPEAEQTPKSPPVGGLFLLFAQNANSRTPLREQVGMKNCRTSTRKPYTIRRGAISAIEKREIRETANGGFYLKAPGFIKNKRPIRVLPPLVNPFFSRFSVFAQDAPHHHRIRDKCATANPSIRICESSSPMYTNGGCAGFSAIRSSLFSSR